MARSKPHIPAVPDELSCGWLTRTLRHSGILGPHGSVSGLRLESLDGGQGLSGEVLRVHLTYTGDAGDAPATMVAKFPTTNVQNRGMIEALNVYEREVLFYRDLAGDMPVPVPKYYGSEMDPARRDPVTPRAKKAIERMSPKAHLAMTRDVTKLMRPSGRRFALLIEDLGEGATVYDLASPPEPDMLAPVLAQLAEVHAHFWGHPILNNHGMFMAAVTDTPMLQRNVFLHRALDECRDRYDFITVETDSIFVEAGERFAEDVARVNRPITLGHGDTRSDNVLFFDDGSFRIVDWAQLLSADPGYDVGYNLTTCIEPHHGRAKAVELARGYHEALTGLGIDHPFEELWESIEATARMMLVQQGLSLVFLQADYGEAGLPCDLWLPRALAILTE